MGKKQCLLFMSRWKAKRIENMFIHVLFIWLISYAHDRPQVTIDDFLFCFSSSDLSTRYMIVYKKHVNLYRLHYNRIFSISFFEFLINTVCLVFFLLFFLYSRHSSDRTNSFNWKKCDLSFTDQLLTITTGSEYSIFIFFLITIQNKKLV